jgi:PPK2 family polyphosphate:nucleotide phosphotransferase
MPQPIEIKSRIRLERFSASHHEGLEKEATREKTRQIRKRIGELQQLLYANQNHAVIVLLQGMDTSGKDGAGRNVLEYVAPTGVETTNFKVPNSEESAHDFLWRVHKAIPRYGHIGIFNRSHYEDVLVTRVMHICPREVWMKRYSQINEFERILAGNNIILLKFFLHMSKDEQARRFHERLKDKTKNWKFDTGDLIMRRKWDDFQTAYEDVINKCNIPTARWHIVPADNKWYRDYVIAKTLCKAMENLKLNWPKPKQDLSKIRID